MFLLVIVEALNLRNISHFLFDGIGVSIHCKKIMLTLSLTPSTLKISLLVVLVFLASLALVGRKLLVLATRYISRRSISERNPSGVLVLLFCRPIPSRTPQIYLANT